MNAPRIDYPLAAESSLFEALFAAVPPGESTRAELLRVGVDPRRLEAKYTVDVWARTIELLRLQAYPEHAFEEGHRLLGHDFGRGFSRTVIGKMILALLPLVKPRALLARAPGFFKLGRPDLIIHWTETSPTSGELRMTDVSQVCPHFDIGLMQSFLERVGLAASARVEPHSPIEFSLHWTW